MNRFSSADRDYDVWALLAHTHHAMFRLRDKELLSYGISPRQSAALGYIQAGGNKATIFEIARLGFRKPQSISEALSRMAEKGLVAKTRRSGTKNVIEVALTEKGREAYRQSTKRETIHKVMSVLSQEERQQLKSCLQKLLNTSLEELGIEGSEMLSTLNE